MKSTFYKITDDHLTLREIEGYSRKTSQRLWEQFREGEGCFKLMFSSWLDEGK